MILPTEVLDVLILLACSCVMLVLMAWWESGRPRRLARRRQRRLWREYINLSTTEGPSYISWEDFQASRG